MTEPTVQLPSSAQRLVSGRSFLGMRINDFQTDDISNTETADSLGLGEEFEELEEQLTSVERRRRAAEKETSKLRDQKSSLRETMDNCDDDIEKWEALQEKLDDGKTVYAPTAKTKKRKRSSSESDSENEDKGSDNSDNESQASDRGAPLTAKDIETKIQELKDQKKEARRGRSEIEAEVKDLNNQIKELKVEARNIEDTRSRICIDARNQYSKSAIQVDFAAGIKEVSFLSTISCLELICRAAGSRDCRRRGP